MKKITAVLLVFALCTGLLTACGQKTAPQKASALDESAPVTLTICGPWPDSIAFENAAQGFHELHPNCTVEYEYLQNFADSSLTRLENAPDSIDFVLLGGSIQSDSPYYPYAEDLGAHPELDLSNTNEALIKNFTFFKQDESEPDRIYSIPLGGEMRGVFVNKTLLASLGLTVPGNASELRDACAVLKDAGYVPINGNPGLFANRFLYPYICNLIANAPDYTAAYNRVANCEEGVSEMFRTPLEYLYSLVEDRYYNYKYVETELNMFTDTSDEGQARDFFNVVSNDSGSYTKRDDVGTVAFMAGTMSQQHTMEKIKEDYHSEIDYEFILTPVGEEGGFAYLSPAHGILLNKNSAHLDWGIEFLNYLFSSEETTRFAKDANYIPNSQDALDYIRTMFDVPDNRVSDLGQATFDYSFYSIINETLVTISKANNPKYMDTDAAGNPVMYDFEYYLAQLEDAFAAQRALKAS